MIKIIQKGDARKALVALCPYFAVAPDCGGATAANVSVGAFASIHDGTHVVNLSQFCYRVKTSEKGSEARRS